MDPFNRVLHLVIAYLQLAMSFPQRGSDIQFIAFGDWGGVPDPPYVTVVQKATAHEMGRVMQNSRTDFVLDVGDNFYYHGVDNVNDFRFKETFENVFTAPSLTNSPWYILAGNHDHLGNVSAQIAYSGLSKRWNFPNLYYKLNFKMPDVNVSVTILMIDTVVICGNTYQANQPGGPEDPWLARKQLQWIRQKLAQSRSDYLMVAGHYPVWSIGQHGPTPCLVDQLRPLLKKYNVTAYISGHDHSLQFIQEGGGVAYIVSGSGSFVDTSTENKEKVPREWLYFYNSDISALGGFVLIQITAEQMFVSYRQPYGMVVFETSLPRRKL
ncbi:tartrate-resistant acid phosphatase type 5b isoform X6 [Scyliorhinus canicula]|uniref:tartrate-resistant acid phosphatase type 5b isoform X6 n=1 Tax=Scyliorhinus canicula TaxID=7830 RepID=UPI0018F76E89|nr:tartrate-resistant acid phosphatase type 5b isoform X6 [Scyliorhinus canicula]